MHFTGKHTHTLPHYARCFFVFLHVKTHKRQRSRVQYNTPVRIYRIKRHGDTGTPDILVSVSPWE